ncbi:cbb3-type cytochrome c oxidase subunit 3 [Sulfitobacter pseudonitzschiae]|uniref:Cbb3-type cytochrome c oxidase subunit 3 n=1 Tax=Pseudosulfitobacter pseudonitzschiae TaxID=1402135 RepID=A0A9Q2NJ49_9RHOB|nr:cbb3-type cytochrome c oxidase subunit 3 [Pseudosulfitobacter pseudonitzschiae]MBM2290971.1 cbb3-type cytochrome c oxidase subunit 3 [Pseudosulfitobacter pseudonitzschiae]MBM2295889.1 cbb3-type cytochrome c oxidase subunit 3 [Pseudosulfitobacter pseudonitzschiae]MBM2300802.1 cbb3-type cytochrome c oxidase subunit 3 [Pseudosulfitobacter pseudonitzschiae]MBM2310586.1 cbb3-type cytochrome c oxidase subunit 3 [Pseudosulfitobacter pseudonitzschiae]MBM2315499.1 cbb3-type cytochrome c oxidase subu
METYSFMRELADSWVLLAMFGFFVAVILWAFRPGSTRTYDAIAQIPLREDSTMGAAQTTQKGASDV